MSVATLPPAQYSVIIHMDCPTGSALRTWLMFLAPPSLRSFRALISLRNSLYVSASFGLSVSDSSMSMILTATSWAVVMSLAL